MMPIACGDQSRDRAEKLARLDDAYDLLIIGGGATGLGTAVDAASRGYKTALVEAGDFAQATSSRATKLVHGGVRYLASGQIHLVYEALRERKLMMQNAPHLVHPLAFITPAYSWFDIPYFGTGLKLYDLLSGSSSIGPTKIVSAEETRQRIPGIQEKGLKGGVMYYDGQFDDARFALALARTAEDRGALVLNYVRCTALLKTFGRVDGAVVTDVETGNTFHLRTKAVINAGGIFSDSVRRMDNGSAPNLLAVSRGTHIVVSSAVLGRDTAIVVPKTRDGRVVFAIPWLGSVVIGTTDLPAPSAEIEPGHDAAEIDYLMETVNPYLARPITKADIVSVFSGLRPLIRGIAATTAKLSREHSMEISESGMVTIAGGKWTTYRRMAEDVIDFAIGKGSLPERQCVSATIKLHGASQLHGTSKADCRFGQYGSDAAKIASIMDGDPRMSTKLDEALPFVAAEVVYGVREEMARTVEDMLARRTRALFLNAKAAQRAAPLVANVMAKELGRDSAWAQRQTESFEKMAKEFYEV
ncbi:MAG: FAD-dependent oxidoreductase [Terracidiphilus sp.]